MDNEARVAALEHLLAAMLKDPKIELNDAKSAFKAADASLRDSDSFAGFTQQSAARKALQEIKSIAGIE